MVLARGAAGRGSERGLLPADVDRGTLRQRAASASYGVDFTRPGRNAKGHVTRRSPALPNSTERKTGLDSPHV